MNGKRLIVDIETLGVSPSAIVLQVALVVWEDGKKKASYLWDVPAREQQAQGRTIDYDTVLWWQTQSREAFKEVAKLAEHSLDYVCGIIRSTISAWQDGGFTEIWANSPSFDLVILSDLLGEPVGSYRQWRDMRTLESLFYEVRGKRAKDMFAIKLACIEGLPHTAAYDAEYQAVLIDEMLKELGK